MSLRVYADAADIPIGLLQVDPIRPGDPSLPFPRLTPVDQEEVRTFRTLVLENTYLRITVLPALGGRIWSVFDKRTSREVLARDSVARPVAGGRRGAILPDGIQLVLQGEDRLNALGGVFSDAEEQEETEAESALVAVWISEPGPERGLSFHQRISLREDEASFEVETRVVNRSFEAVGYHAGLAIRSGTGLLAGSEGKGWFQQEFGGTAISFESDGLSTATHELDRLTLWRTPGPTWLGPRQTDTWSVRFSVWDVTGPLAAVGSRVAASITSGEIVVQASHRFFGAKLVLRTEAGQTLEAAAELYPETPVRIPLEGLPARPAGLVVLAADRTELCRWDSASPTSAAFPELIPAAPAWDLPSLSSTVAQIHPATRSASWTSSGLQHLSKGDFSAALSAFESALLYCGDDPLLWWLKAAATRHLDPQGGDDALPNAHFLAPLEPLLRAEAFLAQPVDGAKEANPLLAAFDEHPEAFVEVACSLIEAGLLADASRFLDEALRHGERIMLHYLQAFCFLQGSRMQVQAAEHVTAASKLPFDPPFPWRAVERRALEVLCERFPEDRRLGEVAALLPA